MHQVQCRRTNTCSTRLQDAAKKLNLGLSVLKRVCRDIGLVRWPYRKRQSLTNVISKTQRFLVSAPAARRRVRYAAAETS